MTNLNAGQVTYRYDANGIRMSETAAGLTTNYLVDPNRSYAQVIEESLDLSTEAEVRYSYGDDLITQHRRIGSTSAESRTFHYDGLGSTRLLTDLTGAITDSYTFTAFCELEDSTGITQNDYLYTGEQYDPNLGFYYLRARYYNLAIGRFPTMDIFPGRVSEPMTLHKYAYVHGNPVVGTDPSGLFLDTTGLTSATNVNARLTLSQMAVRVGLARAVKSAVLATVTGVIASATDSPAPRTRRQETNVMRLQLQQGVDTEYWSEAVGRIEPRFVSRSDIWVLLGNMFADCSAGLCVDDKNSRSFPFNRLQAELRSAIIRMSEWVRRASTLYGG